MVSLHGRIQAFSGAEPDSLDDGARVVKVSFELEFAQTMMTNFGETFALDKSKIVKILLLNSGIFSTDSLQILPNLVCKSH